jgi:hypothetical protein
LAKSADAWTAKKSHGWVLLSGLDGTFFRGIWNKTWELICGEYLHKLDLYTCFLCAVLERITVIWFDGDEMRSLTCKVAGQFMKTRKLKDESTTSNP